MKLTAVKAVSEAPVPINIYSVRNHLEEESWQLLSSEYKNLDTELEMKCPCGHLQKQTYKQWRKRPLCEVCLAGDPYKVKKNKVPAKQTGTYRILALDAATHTTGYAIYDDATLVSYGTFTTHDAETTARIHELKLWLLAALDEWKIDFVGIEHIQLQSYGHSMSQLQVETYRVLANLQGVLLDTLFEAEMPSGLVYSSTWREYCGVGGKERENKKKAAQEKVMSWYNQKCTQDEADAICIGKYFSGLKKKSSWGEPINYD